MWLPCNGDKCDQCDYNPIRKCTLKEHIESKHESVQYICDQCDFKAKLKQQLKRHVKSQHYNILMTAPVH